MIHVNPLRSHALIRAHAPVVMETLAEFVKSGQIKYIGLSECSADVLKRAKAVPVAGERVVAAQMEFSPFELGIEKSGFVAAARELGVAVVAYSPLGRGMITGRWAFSSRGAGEAGGADERAA